jgi:uncharacterized protein (DUF2267 family)
MRLERRKPFPSRVRGSPAKAAEDRHIGFRWLAREARLPGERDAEEVFRGVAHVFGECIGAGEARHIAAHLPLGLRLIWEQETRRLGAPRCIEADELIARVQSRLGLAYRAEAEILLALVSAWLKHLAPEERDDVAAVLGPGSRKLWEDARLPVVPPWRRLAIPASPTF